MTLLHQRMQSGIPILNQVSGCLVNPVESCQAFVMRHFHAFNRDHYLHKVKCYLLD